MTPQEALQKQFPGMTGTVANGVIQGLLDAGFSIVETSLVDAAKEWVDAPTGDMKAATMAYFRLQNAVSRERNR